MTTYEQKTRLSFRPVACAQRGAVLVVALVILAVLTLLSLSGMNNTMLEETMAGNQQETNRAFQAAESGLANVFRTPAAFSLSTPVTSAAAIAGTATDRTTTTTFLAWTKPPVGSGYSSTSFRAAHFEAVSTGNSAAGATRTVRGGGFQIAPNTL